MPEVAYGADRTLEEEPRGREFCEFEVTCVADLAMAAGARGRGAAAHRACWAAWWPAVRPRRRRRVPIRPTPDPTPSASSSALPTTPAPSKPPASPSTQEPTTNQVVIDVSIADGKVDPSGRKVEVPLGATVVLNVTSDIDDEIHAHLGSDDFSLNVQAGRPKTGRFLADAPRQLRGRVARARKDHRDLERSLSRSWIRRCVCWCRCTASPRAAICRCRSRSSWWARAWRCWCPSWSCCSRGGGLVSPTREADRYPGCRASLIIAACGWSRHWRSWRCSPGSGWPSWRVQIG